MTYFNFDFDHQSSIGDGDPVILRISIGFDLDRITNNRVVYGIFNWMSDVGGFQSVLYMFAGFFVSFWNSSEY